MRDNEVYTDLASQQEHMFFEGIVAITIGTTSVTKDKNGSGIRVMMNAIMFPPPAQVISDKFSRLVTVANRDVRFMLLQIIDSVRHYFTFA